MKKLGKNALTPFSLIPRKSLIIDDDSGKHKMEIFTNKVQQEQNELPKQQQEKESQSKIEETNAPIPHSFSHDQDGGLKFNKINQAYQKLLQETKRTITEENTFQENYPGEIEDFNQRYLKIDIKKLSFYHPEYASEFDKFIESRAESYNDFYKEFFLPEWKVKDKKLMPEEEEKLIQEQKRNILLEEKKRVSTILIKENKHDQKRKANQDFISKLSGDSSINQRIATEMKKIAMDLAQYRQIIEYEKDGKKPQTKGNERERECDEKEFK